MAVASIKTKEIAAGDFNFKCRLSGGADGPPVMLLHGCPETSAMWEPLMEDLAAAGYSCMAPDQRGYSSGARPLAVEEYRHERLVGDIFALADSEGWNRFHLVAHDWGAVIGWIALMSDTGRIATYAALSIPHSCAFAKATWSDPETESYREFLELVLAPEGEAERVLSQDDYAFFRASWPPNDPAVPGYLRVIREPGALTSMLAWYRASNGHRRFLDLDLDPHANMQTPTLVLWGRDDPAIRNMAMDLGEQYMVQPHRRIDLDAGHWLVQERFADVRDAVLAHLKSYPLQGT